VTKILSRRKAAYFRKALSGIKKGLEEDCVQSVTDEQLKVIT